MTNVNVYYIQDPYDEGYFEQFDRKVISSLDAMGIIERYKVETRTVDSIDITARYYRKAD